MLISFFTLWSRLQEVHIADYITWKLATNGKYSTALQRIHPSCSRMFDRSRPLRLPRLAKFWALSTLHEGAGDRGTSFVQPSILLRISSGIKEWLGLVDLDTSQWSNQWWMSGWCSISEVHGHRCKGRSSMILLVASGI
jgi:hypothetical protein